MRSFLYSILLFAVGWALFGKTLGFDFVQYDDPAYVTQNGYVQQGLQASSLRWAFFLTGGDHELMHVGVKNLWHPLTWVSHMLDATLYGTTSAAGHHATNVLLHSLSGVLIFFLGRALRLSPLASFIGALLFLIHPTRAESVAWVSERKDVLSGLFFCGAFLLALRQKKGWGLLLFACALMSKPSTVVLPPLLVLTQLWLKQADLLSPRAWFSESKRWVPWFVLALLAAVISIQLQATGSHQAFMGSQPLASRLLLLPLNLLTYLGRIAIPINLTFHYLPPRLGKLFLIATFGAVLGLLFVLYKKRKTHPDLCYPALAFFLCWLPVSGLFYVGTSFTADRYLYLSTLIPFLLIGKGLARTRWSQLTAALVVCFLTVRCWQQLEVWRGTKALFSHAVKVQPLDPKGWTNLGAYLSQTGEKKQAAAHYQKALTLNPKAYFAWHNLGKIQEEKQDYQAALTSYQKGLEASPSSLFLYRAKGRLHQRLQEYEAATRTFQAAVNQSQGRSEIDLMLLTQTQLLAKDFEGARQNWLNLQTTKSQNPVIQDFIQRAGDFFSTIPQSSSKD